MRTCPLCGEINSERARFCQACGTALTEPVEAAGEVRKVVTIVFADMAGSTQVGDSLDPEALRRVQARYFDTLSAAIAAHGGTVEKYIGDAVMAVFGIPRLHEDDALRAVRAAVGMQEALGRVNDELERDHGVRIAMRIGVNTGEVVAGDPSAGQRLVTGDTVNVAARLEEAAAPGEILIGDATYRLVRDAIEADAAKALDLRGKAAPVTVHRLRSVLADAAGHARHLDSPMVGRAKELDLLRRNLERIRDERASHLFTLLGPAGVGKTRLLAEFLGGIGDAVVLRGRCLSYGDGITYYAVGEIVHQAAGIADADDAATALARVASLLAGAEEPDRIARLIGGLFGWADPSSAEDAGWAVRKLVEHFARERPVVVVFDDIHWAEPLLLDLIEHVADWSRDAMLLILCVARPELLELRPGWGGGKMNATTILLEPLAAGDAGSLLDNLVGGADLPVKARERILAAAEGNPLFVEEMIGMLIDDGLLRREDGSWRAVSDLTDLTVPPTIQLLLAARLDRLEAEERAVIERGAVEGKIFHTGAVASLAPEGLRPKVRLRLLALARKELIRPDRAEFAGEDAFRFRHLLIRDAAYQAMPKEQRSELHEGFARWLTGAAGTRLSEYQEILGYHLEQAYRYRAELGPIDERTRELGREAGRVLRRSAEVAQARGDDQTAIDLAERSAALLDGDEHLEARFLLCEILGWWRVDRARPILHEVLRSPAIAELPGLRIRSSIHLVFAEELNDPTRAMSSSRDHILHLLREAEELGDEEAIAACLLGLGQYMFWIGRAGDARATGERLLPMIHRLRGFDRDWVAAMFRMDAYFGETPVDLGLAALVTARRIGGDSVASRLTTDVHEAALFAMADRRTDFDEALDRIDRAWSDLGSPHLRLGAAHARAESLHRVGRTEEAIAFLRGHKAFLDSQGETGINSTTTADIALLLAESGRVDEAEPFIDGARALAAPDDFGSLVPIALATALIRSARGDFDAAFAATAEAERLIRPTDYLNMTADTMRIKGMVLLAASRRGEAEAAFDEALAMFERKGNVASARRLREWLAEHQVVH